MVVASDEVIECEALEPGWREAIDRPVAEAPPPAPEQDVVTRRVPAAAVTVETTEPVKATEGAISVLAEILLPLLTDARQDGPHDG